MNKQELLTKIQLYVIADKKICGNKDIEEVVSQSIDGGAEMIQYRDKESDDDSFMQIACRLKALCKKCGVPFIVNDRIKIALKIDADGVHVGQEDMSVVEAREILGAGKIMGKSAETIQRAIKAEEEGADYVGIGPIFDTLSKEIRRPIGLDIIRQAAENLKIPFFAIGGINLINLGDLIQAGGRRIAVISAVVLSDDIKSSASKLLGKLKTAPNLS